MKSLYRPSFACLLTIAVSVATLLVNRPASAVLIKAGSTTVFADNFESQTTGVSPTTPNAQTGAWAFASAQYTVRDNTSNPVPGAAEGTRYARAVRSGGGAGQTLIADFGAVSSGTVSASFSIYIPILANDYVLQMSLGPNLDASFAGLTTAPVWLMNEGGTVHTYIAPGGDSSDFNTGVPIIQGTWQTWQVNYTFNAGANNNIFTITVAGNTSAPINAGGYNNVADPTSLRYLSYYLGDVGTFYLDAVPVPEPGSLGMLAIGGLLLARRRGRQR